MNRIRERVQYYKYYKNVYNLSSQRLNNTPPAGYPLISTFITQHLVPSNLTPYSSNSNPSALAHNLN